MDENHHRWLSLVGICELLSTNEGHIKWLVKHGFLQQMPGIPSRKKVDARYLDPTPEYARRLKLGESLYGRKAPIPAELDVPGIQLFTHGEIAEILGWTYEKTRKYAARRGIKGTSGTKLHLYSARQIRDIIWKRTGRKNATRRAPYLLQDLIDYFLKYEAAQRELVPTDEQLRQDDALMKRWDVIARMAPEKRELAMREFLDKVRVAREIVTASREGCRPE